VESHVRHEEIRGEEVWERVPKEPHEESEKELQRPMVEAENLIIPDPQDGRAVKEL